MPTYTKQTPLAVRAFLQGKVLAFPEDWNLYQVAEETHRRYKADKWAGGEGEAGRAVIVWAYSKLAQDRRFTSDHWEWISAVDRYETAHGYQRLFTIVYPVCAAASPAWRHTPEQKEEVLKEIDEAAEYLLKIVRSSMRLNIGLRAVAGCFPETQKLLDHSHTLQMAEMEKGFARARSMKAQGAGLGALIEASLSSEYREPDLADFLLALRVAIRGKLKPAYPATQGASYGLFEDMEPEDADALRARMGMSWSVDPMEALRAGGEFGGQPNRQDALRRAVMVNFPEAVYEDRLTAPPSTPLAAMIEAALTAWFGTSPTQKEINKAIKPQRDALEPIMQRHLAGYISDAEKRAARVLAGMDPDAIAKLELQDFLAPDNEPEPTPAELAAIENPPATKVAKRKIKPAGKGGKE